MKAKFLRKGLLIAVLSAAILVPVKMSLAADGLVLKSPVSLELNSNSGSALTSALAEVKKEADATPAFAIKSTEELQFDVMLSDIAVASTDNFLFVYKEAAESKNWVGKLYNMSEVTILENHEDWLLIKSGSVKGYVRANNILTGRDAIEAIKEAVREIDETADLFTMTREDVFSYFLCGETKQEESVRLAQEETARLIAEKEAEEARIEAEKAAQLEKGKSVISYAKQFLGNPYVYGGTSLTRGTDCSGFVRGVYSHFGIYLPRSSYYQRHVGEKVSYDEMQPGDIVCYRGHVALYAGNGKIVHAANERKGITISDVDYATIISIRRVL